MTRVTKVFTSDSIDTIDSCAQEFIAYISSCSSQSNIFAFFGRMGAGKTTFIKAICKALGAVDDVNSPTFTIVNEYRSAKGFPIFHFDFYRINSIKEAYDIGVDEYFSGNGLCLIEWSEKIEEILPENCNRVDIDVAPDGIRTITVSYPAQEI